MKLTLEQALQKGIEAHKVGKVQEADRYYTAILKANPKHTDANHNMGVLAVGVGKVEQALPFFETALEANSSIAQFWLSYINALIKLDRVVDAQAAFDQAKSNGAKGDTFDQIGLQLSTSTVEVKNQTQEDIPTQPNILDELTLDKALKLAKQNAKAGLSEEAKKIYQDILKKFPKNKKAIDGIKILAGETLANTSGMQEPRSNQLKSLANLFTQGQYQQATTQASQLLKQFPNSTNLYNILGAANQSLGRLEDAIEAYAKAISIKPDYADAYNNLGNALNGRVFKRPNRVFQKTIVSLLDRERYIRPADIATAAISLLKFEPTLQRHLQVIDGHVIKNPLSATSDLNELTLLIKLMSVCPIPDLELEVLLTNLRHSILVNISSLQEESSELIRFQSALALQCFTNEYIYHCTDVEEKILRSLEAGVEKTLEQDEQPSPQIILGLASYKALNEYDWCKLLVVTDHIKDVFDRQVEEPNQEQKLKQELPVLEEITDTVSSKVREQYEGSPYPRWVNLRVSYLPMSISDVITQSKLKLHHNKITEVEKPNILVAGCGTGQHSIGTAARFKSSKVLAIDLSLSSLAYAKRKTEELAVGNIEYIQADILNIGQLNKQFDIIESVGVLHHMDNPMAGWKVLTDCVKSGGLMKIGLYSELARKHIVNIREEIVQTGIGSSHADIRSFRNTLIKSDKGHNKKVFGTPDFYSMSELRDLLFHVQEHRFTIPQIKNYLNELELKFCGFEAKQIVSHFKQTYKNKDDLYDLDKWQSYEEANPRAFAGMYQFWCQKVD